MEKLHFTAADGALSLVSSLLASGAELDVHDDLGYTPLHYAAKHDHYKIAELLINHGADVNANDEERIGETPLAVAVRSASPGLVELLLQKGADPTISGWMGLTALDRATKRRDEDGVEIQRLLALRVHGGTTSREL